MPSPSVRPRSGCGYSSLDGDPLDLFVHSPRRHDEVPDGSYAEADERAERRLNPVEPAALELGS
jgi:hypothetical protein